MAYALGIDIGTTYTAAALWRDGRAETVTLGLRSTTIPSLVYLRDDGEFLVGDAAHTRARMEPTRLAREFKRRLGDSVPLILGDTPVSPQQLTAEMLKWVAAKATELEGSPPDEVVLTYPANWGPFKKALIEEAAKLASLPCQLITEPEAAAVYYAGQERLEPGSIVAVYDLGGGTFDVTILTRSADGFEILGQPEGIEHLGGIDFDQAVFAHTTNAIHERWARLDMDDPAVLSAVSGLRESVTRAKEALSDDVVVDIPVILPEVATDVRLTRTEFEQMVRSPLTSTVEVLHRALVSADVQPSQLRAVLLVGGSSRIPLVAGLLASELGRPVAVDTHPKFCVALGAATIAGASAGLDVPAAILTATDQESSVRTEPEVRPEPPAPPPVSPQPAPEQASVPDPQTIPGPPEDRDQGRRTRTAVLSLVAIVLVAAVVAGGYFVLRAINDGSSEGEETSENESGSGAETATAVSGPFQPGDCINYEGASSGSPAVVACESQHEAEVFHTRGFDWVAGDYDEATWDDLAANACGPAFESYVGVPVEDSQYRFNWFFPSAGSYAEGDRTVTCFAEARSGEQTTGSMEGTAS